MKKLAIFVAYLALCYLCYLWLKSGEGDNTFFIFYIVAGAIIIGAIAAGGIIAGIVIPTAIISAGIYHMANLGVRYMNATRGNPYTGQPYTEEGIAALNALDLDPVYASFVIWFVIATPVAMVVTAVMASTGLLKKAN